MSPVRVMEQVTPTRTNGASAAGSWWATWVAGPDCGATTPLDPGETRWMVGRAAGAAIRCDDTALAPHHAVVEMCPAGAAPGGATG
ncbi:MAG: hypothetical protein ACO3AV_11525, partial [Ilumatobacteraceae bacterium]